MQVVDLLLRGHGAAADALVPGEIEHVVEPIERVAHAEHRDLERAKVLVRRRERSQRRVRKLTGRHRAEDTVTITQRNGNGTKLR